MDFITLTISCDEDKRELLIAELSLLSFDAFEEMDEQLTASCEEDVWDEISVKEILDRYAVSYKVEKVARVNWNEEWEKNYDPVIIGDQCIVRATFHQPQPQFPYEIIITPKMSFGTGHHATTWQVLNFLLGQELTGKKVIDVGCGTGALAIMAHKRGATEIDAVDIDEWCIENSRENFSLNDCAFIDLWLGGIETVDATQRYDLMLVNINKNVLMEQMQDYALRLPSRGKLILSGFYVDDIPDLKSRGEEFGLHYISQSERSSWAMLVLEKE